MGRRPLGAAEAARLAVAAVVLLPLWVVAAVLLLVAYYLVCRVCTLWVEEERERDGAARGRATRASRAGGGTRSCGAAARSRAPCSSSSGSTGSAWTTAASPMPR
jgi:lysophosphatidylcholine acyltransferase/lyso-PAF acetyltransferase